MTVRLFSAVFSGPLDLVVRCDYAAGVETISNWLINQGFTSVPFRSLEVVPDGALALVKFRLASPCKVGAVYTISNPDGSVYAYSGGAWGRFYYLDIEGLPPLGDALHTVAPENGRVVIDSRFFHGVGAIRTTSSKLDPYDGKVSREIATIRLIDDSSHTLGNLFATRQRTSGTYEFMLDYPATAADGTIYLLGTSPAQVLTTILPTHLYIEGEAMLVTAVDASNGRQTACTVTRAEYGTTATAHAYQSVAYLENQMLEGRACSLYICEEPVYSPECVYKGFIESVVPSMDGLGFDFKIADVLKGKNKPTTTAFAKVNVGFRVSGAVENPLKIATTAQQRDNVAAEMYDEDDYSTIYAIMGAYTNAPSLAWQYKWWASWLDPYWSVGTDNPPLIRALPLVRGIQPPSTLTLSQFDLPAGETERGWDEILNSDAPESSGYDATATGCTLLCKPRQQLFDCVELARKSVRLEYQRTSNIPQSFAYARAKPERGYNYIGVRDIIIGSYRDHDPNLERGYIVGMNEEAAYALADVWDSRRNQLILGDGARVDTVEECIPLADYDLSPIQAAVALLTGYIGGAKTIADKYHCGFALADVEVASGGDLVPHALAADGVVCRDTGDALIDIITKELLAPVAWFLTVKRTGGLLISSFRVPDYASRIEIDTDDLLSISAPCERLEAAINQVTYKAGYDVHSQKFSKTHVVRVPALGGKEKKFELKLLAASQNSSYEALKAAVTYCGLEWINLFGKPQYSYTIKVADTATFRTICPGMWLKLNQLALGTNRFGQGETVNGDGFVLDTEYHIDEGFIKIKFVVSPRAVNEDSIDDGLAARQAFAAPLAGIGTGSGVLRLGFSAGVSTLGRPYGMPDGARLMGVDYRTGVWDTANKFTPSAWTTGVGGLCVATVPDTTVLPIYEITAVDRTAKTITVSGDKTIEFGNHARAMTSRDEAEITVRDATYDAGADETTMTIEDYDTFPGIGNLLWSREICYVIEDYDDLPSLTDAMTRYHVFMDDGKQKCAGAETFEGEYEYTLYPAPTPPTHEVAISGDVRYEFGDATGKDVIVWNATHEPATLEVVSVSYDSGADETTMTLSGTGMAIGTYTVHVRRAERGASYIAEIPGGEVSSGSGKKYTFS